MAGKRERLRIAALTGASLVEKSQLMSEWFGEEGWDDLHPTDIDFEVGLSYISEIGKEEKNDGDIDETYMPKEHEKMDRGVWSESVILPYPVGVALSYYLRLLGDVRAKKLLEVMGISGLLERVEKRIWLKRASALTDWVKRRGPLIENWRDYIDLGLLAGFNLNKITVKEQEEILSNWCKGKFNRSDKTKLDVIKNIKKVLSPPGTPGSFRQLTLEEFVGRPDLWVTKGSGKGEKAVLHDNDTGETILGNSTKAAIAVNKSVSEICSDLYNTKSEIFSVSGKVEVGGKGRIIISPGYELNLLLAYVLYPIEHMLKRTRDDSPLWSSAEGVDAMWRKLVGYCKNKSRWIYPQDVSKFDQTVATDEYWAIFDAMARWIVKHGKGDARTSMLKAIDAAKTRMAKAKVIIPDSKKIMNWDHGMPSGVRITAIGDTAISLGRSYSIFGDKDIELWGMGDDLLLVSRSPLDPMLLYKQTVDMGIDVNPAKNFVSYNHAEFLRVAGDVTGARGYPARHVIKCLFYEPGEEKAKKNDVEWARARAASLWLFAARGCDADFVKCEIKRSLQWCLGKNSEMWVHTHSSLGGLGLSPLLEFGLAPEKLEVKQRYTATEFGSYGLMADNTFVYGVEEETVLNEIGNRAARGLPGSMTLDYAWRETIATRVDTALMKKILDAMKVYSNNNMWPDYRINEKITGPIFSGPIISKLIEKGNWDELIRVAGDECKALASAMVTRAERKLAIAWFKNKLPKLSPMVELWGMQGMASLSKIATAQAQQWVLKQHRMSYLLYVTAVVTAEECVIKFAVECDCKLGY